MLVEACAGTSLAEALKTKGHSVNVVRHIGCLGHVVGIDHGRRRLIGASDPSPARSKWDGRTGSVGVF